MWRQTILVKDSSGIPVRRWEEPPAQSPSLYGFKFCFLLFLFFKWGWWYFAADYRQMQWFWWKKTTKSKKHLIFYKRWSFLVICLSCTQRATQMAKLVLFSEDFKYLPTGPTCIKMSSLMLSHDDKLKCVYCGIFRGYHKIWSLLNEKILMTNIKQLKNDYLNRKQCAYLCIDI